MICYICENTYSFKEEIESLIYIRTGKHSKYDLCLHCCKNIIGTDIIKLFDNTNKCMLCENIIDEKKTRSYYSLYSFKKTGKGPDAYSYKKISGMIHMKCFNIRNIRRYAIWGRMP